MYRGCDSAARDRFFRAKKDNPSTVPLLDATAGTPGVERPARRVWVKNERVGGTQTGSTPNIWTGIAAEATAAGTNKFETTLPMDFSPAQGNTYLNLWDNTTAPFNGKTLICVSGDVKPTSRQFIVSNGVVSAQNPANSPQYVLSSDGDISNVFSEWQAVDNTSADYTAGARWFCEVDMGNAGWWVDIGQAAGQDLSFRLVWDDPDVISVPGTPVSIGDDWQEVLSLPSTDGVAGSYKGNYRSGLELVQFGSQKTIQPNQTVLDMGDGLVQVVRHGINPLNEFVNLRLAGPSGMMRAMEAKFRELLTTYDDDWKLRVDLTLANVANTGFDDGADSRY